METGNGSVEEGENEIRKITSAILENKKSYGNSFTPNPMKLPVINLNISYDCI